MQKVAYNFHKLGIRTKIYVLLLNQLDKRKHTYSLQCQHPVVSTLHMRLHKAIVICVWLQRPMARQKNTKNNTLSTQAKHICRRIHGVRGKCMKERSYFFKNEYKRCMHNFRLFTNPISTLTTKNRMISTLPQQHCFPRTKMLEQNGTPFRFLRLLSIVCAPNTALTSRWSLFIYSHYL